MDFERLLSTIRRHTQLTEQEEMKLCAILRIKKLKRKEFLVRVGDDARHEYFVNKGCLRTYYIDEKGTEHNTYFAIEGYWLSDIYSRTFNTPALCSIVALEDSELVHIPNIALEELLIDVPALERFFRISYQKSLATIHLKQIQLLSMNGCERYNYFREKYPEIDKRVPQKHIASYLGFTPEFFNTVRSKAIREKVLSSAKVGW
ncbi:cAMP-binding domain of CRP or a regulatory subunit of cAMP-dependent protein kinases [Chitinophaga sp. YR627]|uniref:Crp/Fnr family transcriptional regulator n=1 Tax=Chitinophaga sp. YR627 TaxID=1881041 RepID=UPI0008E68EC9|nr:Crp/Fnr family transcriptional regulator [Chitinophaga sp. YR627]SFM78749.1 cAMP-binding domain of CRP or a regulatory subunit of cAMP-dependent protein kinases [Chitinophaga sp. YR627]